MTRSVKLGFILLLSASLIGCASNKKFVADQTAARMYHFDRYSRICVQEKGPPTCKEMQRVLNVLLKKDESGNSVGLIPLANAVQQVGEIPKMERRELKRLMDELERLP